MWNVIKVILDPNHIYINKIINIKIIDKLISLDASACIVSCPLGEYND